MEGWRERKRGKEEERRESERGGRVQRIENRYGAVKEGDREGKIGRYRKRDIGSTSVI